MMSAQGSDRTDLVLDADEEIHEDCPAVGITLQARLRRTRDDLDRVLTRPGAVRLAVATAPTVGVASPTC